MKQNLGHLIDPIHFTAIKRIPRLVILTCSLSLYTATSYANDLVPLLAVDPAVSEDLKITGKLRSALYFEKIELEVEEIISVDQGVVTIRNSNLNQHAIEKIVVLSKQIPEVTKVKISNG